MNYTRTRFLIGSFLAFLAWVVMLLMGGKGVAADVWAAEWLSVAGKPEKDSLHPSISSTNCRGLNTRWPSTR